MKRGMTRRIRDPLVSGHDLNLFVTVQLLEETPAVLSMSGSAVKSHG